MSSQALNVFQKCIKQFLSHPFLKFIASHYAYLHIHFCFQLFITSLKEDAKH